MYKIFIVEDDEVILNTIKTKLETWGFECIAPTSFQDVLSTFLKIEPHLVIMDIKLPYYDGFHWCTKIRAVSSVPILFLSSLDAPMDVKMAIALGADDYVFKPFSMTILESKIQAILRRSYDYTQDHILSFQGAVLNRKGVLMYQGEKIELTKNEYRILYELLKQKSSIVSRSQLIEALWEDESFIDDNTLTVNIVRLRKKVKDIGLEDVIKTKKGEGYYIDETIS